jgi:hypothetical protein
MIVAFTRKRLSRQQWVELAFWRGGIACHLRVGQVLPPLVAKQIY